MIETIYYAKKKDKSTKYYLVYGFRQQDYHGYGEWYFLMLNHNLHEINEFIERYCKAYDEIRVLIFDPDLYGQEFLWGDYMGFKVVGTLELSIDDMKTAIHWSNLLSAVISSERSKKGLLPVSVDEGYFIRYAINECI